MIEPEDWAPAKAPTFAPPEAEIEPAVEEPTEAEPDTIEEPVSMAELLDKVAVDVREEE